MSDDPTTLKTGDTAGKVRSAGKILGESGERFAATWLEARGYQIVARNWRCRYGELDIIARYDGELVFFEVKTRRGRGMGLPEEAITHTKRRRLVLAAQAYMAEHDCDDAAFRIDVLAIELTPSGTLCAVRHYPHGIELEE